jgi:hypothetical protein
MNADKAGNIHDPANNVVFSAALIGVKRRRNGSEE